MRPEPVIVGLLFAFASTAATNPASDRPNTFSPAPPLRPATLPGYRLTRAFGSLRKRVQHAVRCP